MDRYPIAIIAGQLVLGGAERQLYLWLSHLNRDRFAPVVVTLHPGCGDHWEPEVERLGIPLLRVARGANRFARLIEVTRRLGPYRPQLIHGWHLFASPYAGVAAKLLGARASLASVRGSYSAYRARRVERLLAGWLTDALLVNSRTAAAQLRANGGGPGRIYVVPNAVEEIAADRSAARARLSAKWGIPPGRQWIGSAGRFQQSKRFDLLLELVARLLSGGQNVHLLLIGYGPLEAALRAQAVRLGIEDRVTFTGEDPTVRFWISALDVFCFPSEDEGLPNAVLEASAGAVAVAAWRTPFLEEALGGTAALADPGNLGKLEAAVIDLLRSASGRRELGEKARQHVLERFGLAQYVAGLTDVYEELLAS